MPSGQYLPQAINALHMAARERDDAEGVAVITKCLSALAQLQAKDHQANSDNGQAVSAVMQQLGGSGGAAPPGY